MLLIVALGATNIVPAEMYVADMLLATTVPAVKLVEATMLLIVALGDAIMVPAEIVDPTTTEPLV